MADPTTPGKKTSEFWLTVGTVLSSVAGAGALFASDMEDGTVMKLVIGLIVAAASAVATYINARGKVKAARALPLPPPQ